MVGGNFEQFGRVPDPVDFVQNEPSAGLLIEESFRILFHRPSDPWQFAIIVGHIPKRAGQGGFPDTSNPGKPYDGALLPSAFNRVVPKFPIYHMQMKLTNGHSKYNFIFFGCARKVKWAQIR
jgi:hypothetical protein